MKRLIPFLAASLLFWLVAFRLTVPTDHPPAHDISPFPLIAQPDEITCGPTSATMVLAKYGIDRTVSEVEVKTKTKWFRYKGRDIGMTAPEYVATALTQLGVPSSLKGGGLDELKHYVGLGRPVIVLVRSGEYLWHYFVVVGYDEQDVVIADPAGGRRYNMRADSFLGAWAFDFDLDGNPMGGKCAVCGGTGQWLRLHLGPLSLCEACDGTGRKPDYIRTLLLAAEIRPMTMIVPSINTEN